jgi:predicted ArsR family transcriptional regulator
MADLRFRANTPDVMHETIDGEVIAINLVSGNYYSFRETGAEIWALIDELDALSVDELAHALALRYASPPSEIESAVARFLEELVAEGLVARAEGQAESRREPAEQPAGVPTQVFSLPRVEKYTDMQDLVLLDPVHQVDDTGWPRARPEAVRDA